MMRIAITGPESCGKSTLGIQLSESFNADYVAEYAVDYLSKTGGVYAFDDLENIAQGHVQNVLKSQNSIQIIDTDFIVLQIWSQVRFGKVSPVIRDLIAQNLFDHYLLCAPDIPWQQGPFRENPNDREALFEMYRQALDSLGLSYTIITGDYDARLKKAIGIISRLKQNE